MCFHLSRNEQLVHFLLQNIFTFWLFIFVFLFSIATEIRCQEKSKGGLCYEVILGQPVTIPPLKQNKEQSSLVKKVSADEIARKLKEAEKRRLVRKINQIKEYRKNKPDNLHQNWQYLVLSWESDFLLYSFL